MPVGTGPCRCPIHVGPHDDEIRLRGDAGPDLDCPGNQGDDDAARTCPVLVVGDSVADGAAQSMAAVARDFGAAVVNRAVWGCGIFQSGPFRYFGALTMQPPQ